MKKGKRKRKKGKFYEKRFRTERKNKVLSWQHYKTKKTRKNRRGKMYTRQVCMP